MLLDPDPADWLMWRRTLNSWGHSPLDQIDATNVGDIRMTWTRGLPEGSMEGTPLVHDGVMFFPNPGDIVQAIDAVTGDLLWEYRGEVPEDWNDYFPAADINRNLAIYDGLIIGSSMDSQVYALSAQTGELVWKSRVRDYHEGSQQTSGPIVAGGKVFSGRGCEPEGGPEACVVTAHDALTGEELWRRSTIPAPGEPNYESWGDLPYEERVHVGTWMVPSYDTELNLVFVGTSVTMPAPKYQLSGNDLQYLYHNSTLALDGDTGEIVWWYQHVVDHWDIDHPFERLVLETEIAPDPEAVDWINPDIAAGETRKVITGIPGKSGIVYTLDAATGEFLWARPTVYQNLVSDIDGATGRVTNNPDAIMYENGAQVTACPSAQGGKNWQAGAYSPDSGLMYMPLQNTCSDVTAVPGGLYGIRTRGALSPGATGVGSIHAIDASTGRTAWTFQNRAPMMSLMTTGGGLVFGGDGNGRFRALDDESGEVLWEINLGSAVTGFPVTYSVDGKQYVAVATGSARSALAPELRPSTTNNLFVFTLP
jgi:alcohol dehydrogenase (cytochrome c)